MIADALITHEPTLKRHAKWLIPLCLVVAGVLVYLNTLHNGYVFDDTPWVVNNERIRSLSNLGEMLTATNRPLLEITLAVDYAIGGLAPAPYRLTNMLIHILAGLTLFGLVRRTLGLATISESVKARATWLAGAVALLWLVHPLNTQSVSYLIQRGESMMGLFYLLTLYGFVRYATAEGRRWAVFAVVACWLGAGCKEVIATAPLVVLLYDWVFIAKNWREPIVKRWGVYAGLFAMWLPLGFMLVRGLSGEDASAGFALEGKLLSRWTYLLTQAQVIVEVYLRKAFWPKPLVLDYGWWPAIPHDTPADQVGRLFMANVFWQGLLLIALLLASLWGLIRKRWWGFVGMSFFLILAPTSSFVPIADIAVEHRMYLPLICVLLIVVFLGDAVLRRAPGKQAGGLGAAIVVVAALALGVQTFARNLDYHSGITLWDANVIARPNNPRAWHNLGSALDKAGRRDEAMLCYEKVLERLPNYHEAIFGIAGIWMDRGDIDKAVELFKEAVRLNPGDASYHAHLGQAYMLSRQYDFAEQSLDEAIRLDPTYARAYETKGLLSLAQNDLDGAIANFRKAIEVDPDQMASRKNLAAALNDAGEPGEAVQVMNEAIEYARITDQPTDLTSDLVNRRDRYQARALQAPAGP